MDDGEQPLPWAAIVPLSVTVTVAFGIMFYGFSVYLTDGATGADFSTSVLSLAYGGAALIGGLLALPVGRYADRHGIRRIIGVGSVAGFLGMAAFAASEQPWQIVAAWWLLIGPAVAMTSYEPAFAAIDQWCTPGQRPRALATLTVIGGLAGVVFIPGSERLNATVGWRPAVLILGALLLAIGGATALFAIPGGRTPSLTPGRSVQVVPALGNLLRQRKFRLYTIAMMLSFFAAQGIVSHRVALFEDAGFAVGTVVVWAAVASILSLPGRWLAPSAVLRYRASSLQVIATLMIAGSVLLMIAGSGSWRMAGHFVVFGLAFGTILPLRALMMASWYSGHGYGQIMGTQWTAVAIAGAAGAPTVGVLRDLTGGYRVPMAMLTITNLLVSALIVTSDHRQADSA